MQLAYFGQQKMTQDFSSPPDHQKRQLEAAVAAASDALSLEELAAHALPRLSEAVGACDAIMFSFAGDGVPFGIGKGQFAMEEYVSRGYIRDDPQYRVGRRDDAAVRVASDLIERKEMHRSRAYREFFAPGHVEYTANLRITPSGFGEPDTVCLLMMRRPDQIDFTRSDAAMMSSALPALQSAVRRHARIQGSVAGGKMLESVVETLVGEPVVVFDKDGRLLWRSEGAYRIVECSDSTRDPLSASLRVEARKLALRAQRDPSWRPTAMGLELPPSSGPRVASADLMLANGPRGHTYVVARLREGKPNAMRLGMLADNYDLTPSETAVLSQIAQGLSNKEIAAQQRISIETARTHVHRVLQKLGVSSRTRAALRTREG